jgi:hypothetical protein
MAISVKVPKEFEPLFDMAEGHVSKLFEQFQRTPTKGTLHIGGERYVLIRGQSLFIALFDQLQDVFGDEQAHSFIYNMARAIGESDCKAFSEERKLTDPTARLSTGPVHFSWTGWAFVDIFPTSRPAPDQTYFLHYQHPNTFESEIYQRKQLKTDSPVCYFSAGYSAGWCSEAYGIEVHAREIRCVAKGDSACEFIMAPYEKLDDYAREYGR